jgi:DNA-directed RNA polymerase sigma subunit (sigma70/sigma32)
LEKESKDFADIKKLLVLIATKNGATSAEIGKLLGVDASRIRQILSGLNKKGRGKQNE